MTQSNSAQYRPHAADPIDIPSIRVAWLFPSLTYGGYWHPVFKAFSQIFPQTKIYTGGWEGFVQGFEETFCVEVLDTTQFIYLTRRADGHPQQQSCAPNIGWPSPRLLPRLWQFRPHVIYTSAFSIWTLWAVALKPLLACKVVILHDGCSPTYDYRKSWWRLPLRRWLMGQADAAMTNGPSGKAYLVDVLRAPPAKVCLQPYQVPNLSTLLPKAIPADRGPEAADSLTSAPIASLSVRPMQFLFMGRLVMRKGLNFLLQACAILKARGYEQFNLMIIGEGESEADLKVMAQQLDLSNLIWEGRVAYDQVGRYFAAADVFVFPTLEDVWGMVLLEAMACGKPALCSRWAGAAEVMVIDGHNGYQFEPRDPDRLATLMQKFLDDPTLATQMGAASQQMMAQYTPEAATEAFVQMTQAVIASPPQSCPSPLIT
jgi:glycosyltransferase involved in cell wall biosynthesis